MLGGRDWKASCCRCRDWAPRNRPAKQGSSHPQQRRQQSGWHGPGPWAHTDSGSRPACCQRWQRHRHTRLSALAQKVLEGATGLEVTQQLGLSRRGDDDDTRRLHSGSSASSTTYWMTGLSRTAASRPGVHFVPGRSGCRARSAMIAFMNRRRSFRSSAIQARISAKVSASRVHAAKQVKTAGIHSKCEIKPQVQPTTNLLHAPRLQDKQSTRKIRPLKVFAQQTI